MNRDPPPASDARRSLTAHLETFVVDEADVALAIAVAENYERVGEHLSATLNGYRIDTAHHGQVCVVRNVGRGSLIIDYQATVVGVAPPAMATDLDVIRYIRPSRYCESDRLGPLARAEFAGLEGTDLLAGVSNWVGANIAYVPGSSRPIDGAVSTLLAREGVCRDFAHLSAALLRANNIPARVVSVYAPGLFPMDFHVVTEACIDGAWYVVDPTGLAPRELMVRIATGADASDVAFLTTLRGIVELNDVTISAMSSSTAPWDDGATLTRLR